MKKLSALILSILMLVSSLNVFVIAEGENPFTDVKENDWYYDAVTYFYKNGIFKGTNDEGTIFSPDRNMTRAEFAAKLFRIAGKDDSLYTGPTGFIDVPEGSWMSAAIKWAYDNSVINGYGNGIFDPDGELTREQLAVILYNYAATLHDVSTYDESVYESFVDKDNVSLWAVPAIKWMTGIGLLQGITTYYGTIVSPDTTATRAQAAQIFIRYIEKCEPTEPVAISDGRQLFTDDYIVDTEKTDAPNEYGTLTKKEAVFTFNARWEREDAVYHNIVKAPDGTYRMYYKATSDYRRICYIESEDGITWKRPRLTTNTLNGDYISTNIVSPEGYWPDNLFVFYDTNPNCPEDQRWKGIYGEWANGLYLVRSVGSDGNQFFGGSDVKVMNTPSETEGCYFDSLNTVYWDQARGKYVAFVRGFHAGNNYNLPTTAVQEGPDRIIRDVRYSESDDCINWSIPVPLEYSDSNDWQMYTNGVMPYDRAGIYIALPTKFTYEPMTTATLLMTSRDLKNWERNTTPVITPPSYEHAVHGDCFACVGYIQTAEDELSFYMREWDDAKNCMVLYRYTMRIDGFRSRGSASEDSTVVTKLLTFEGDSFEINHDGNVKVIIKDTKGNAVFEHAFTGDNVASSIELGAELTKYKGKMVTVTFELDNAKVYSFKFN